ncbi:OLC1v1014377C1 [Oldenlandia corymbosa var. corymbosa]|uniref:OLC1v1014377C1 n=1 Tax=Oldenlandia corymbosa var. corymbosa TaxID=529605 RepID=A0AAV1E0J6_OLDCO|nr:OLC1v1014377C1 [Oldenlandia corymbosa var. corymbosa]
MTHIAKTPMDMMPFNGGNASNVQSSAGNIVNTGPENLQAIMNGLNYLQQEMRRLTTGKGIQNNHGGKMVNFAHYAEFAGPGGKEVIDVGKVVNGLYVIDQESFSQKHIMSFIQFFVNPKCCSIPQYSTSYQVHAVVHDETIIWHNRLGHPSHNVIK